MYNGSTGKPIRGNNIFTIAAVVAVVAIIITNGLLVLLMLKSIMEPLSILRRRPTSCATEILTIKCHTARKTR